MLWRKIKAEMFSFDFNFEKLNSKDETLMKTIQEVK